MESTSEAAKDTLHTVVEYAASSFDSEAVTVIEMNTERDSALSDPLDDELYNSHEENGDVFDDVPETDVDIDGGHLLSVSDGIRRMRKIPTFLETSYESDVDSGSENGFEIRGSDLARAHWIQLHKTNKQGLVIQHTFLELIRSYRHMRPIWPFGRRSDVLQEDWDVKLLDDFYFRHHCASIQAAFTMLMEHKDERGNIGRLLNELGAHHFFYDATEPHFECFQHAFMESLRKKCVGINKMDEETEISWKKFMIEIKTKIGEGIAIQRNNYLRLAVTSTEIELVRDQWDEVIEYGLTEAGSLMCAEAIAQYKELLSKYNMNGLMPAVDKDEKTFTQFVTMTMTAFNVAVHSWSPKLGFVTLPDLLSDYVVRCMLLDVCPTLLRKAVQHGLLEMLKKVVGADTLNEVSQQAWSKMYRVTEQAIISNIVDY